MARLPSTRKADHRACTDPSLRAAQEGWGTTLRYGLLRLARPAAVGAAGGAAGVSGALVPKGVLLAQQGLESDPPNPDELGPWPLFSSSAHALQPSGLGGLVNRAGHGFRVRLQKHVPLSFAKASDNRPSRVA